MDRLHYLKSALIGGASVLTLAHPAVAKEFDIPRGDLAAALDAYMQQAGVEIVYSNDVVRGHRSPGAKGDFTETTALTEVLRGTGFTTQTMPANIIGIVPEKPVRVAQAAPRKPAAAAPVPAQREIETIVVTAERKQENIQSVPIAVSAFTQEQLTEHQIAGGPDLIKEVPNLTFSKTNFTGYNIEIRGIGTQAISVATDPAVSVAFNGTPFIHNHFFEQEFYDLDNVEVLRGPQGTLWGRNSNAGVVNVISAKATDHFEAMGSIDIGNYSNRRFEGMINLPIVGDKLDLRMAGEWTKRDGYSFNDTTHKPIDGRDLWSGRLTVGFRPVKSFEADFVWEHFYENDDRLRSGKQLCKTDFGTATVTDWNGHTVTIPVGSFLTGNISDPFAVTRTNFSQGCLPTSLYSKDAFQVPYGPSLPFVSGAAFESLIYNNIDPYAQTTQSTNLRHIQSVIAPRYLAKNDTLEFNTTWNATPWLTVHSDTGYNRDFLWSSEDYNRFDTSPGIFKPEPVGHVGGSALGNAVSANGVFCDPQLGCSDRLVVQDLAEEHSWQFSQEFRAESDFDGPLNFSAGANYLHYEISENYYVFSNTFTLIALDNPGCNGPGGQPVPYVPGVTTNDCALGNGYGYPASWPNVNSQPTASSQHIDPNPITNLDNEGHNYFLSQNPYVLNSYALFGEAYYNVTNDLKLTAGLRWTDDEKHFPEIPSELLALGWGYPSMGAVDQKWNEWTGRFVANWTPKLDFTDQTMFYASYAHGYKAGGANPPGPLLVEADISTGAAGSGAPNVDYPVHPLTFKPEHIEAFELGTKNSALDGNLVVNGDVFYYNYHAYQISQIVDRTSINLNFNASVEGAEIQSSWSPLPGLKLGFNGGYEATKIGSNQYAIDLIDRTAGHPGWVVMKPSIGQASNCILPDYVVAAMLQQQVISGFGEGNPMVAACGYAYSAGDDPVTDFPYQAYPPYTNTGHAHTPAGYPGFDPTTAPNNGEGFAKPLGGKELPNAPHFTASLTADYTMPVSPDWATTLHGDFYYQSDSWARVFNDNPYDRIHGYTNLNLALIFTDTTGWQVMAYVKNVFDTTAITGDFLNSDDTGLTTNIFLTDPRLYGVRVTKHFGEGSWSEGGGLDFIPDFFADKDGKRPSLWLELGGDFAQLDDGWQKFSPPFVSIIPHGLPSLAKAENSPTTAFDWEAKLSYQPEDSDWVLKAGIRYGRTGVNKHIHNSGPIQTIPGLGCPLLVFGGAINLCTFSYYGQTFKHLATQPHVAAWREFSDAQGGSSERYTILDFTAGKDVGLGMFGADGKGTIGGGVRVAQFTTHAMAELNTDPHYVFERYEPKLFKYHQYHYVYDAKTKEKRSFHGLGPELTWDASQPVLGNADQGQIAIDWGLNGAVLFGRQSVNIQQKMYGLRCGMNCQGYGRHVVYSTTKPPIRRSREVTVPNLGGYIGLSMDYKNAKVSFGYRADEFFGAIDGGQGAEKSYNRGFFGPYMNISIGLGG